MAHAVSKVLMIQCPFVVCELPMRGRYAAFKIIAFSSEAKIGLHFPVKFRNINPCFESESNPVTTTDLGAVTVYVISEMSNAVPARNWLHDQGIRIFQY